MVLWLMLSARLEGFGTAVFVVADDPGITIQTAVDLLVERGCARSEIVQYDGSGVAQMAQKGGGGWELKVNGVPSSNGSPVRYMQ